MDHEQKLGCNLAVGMVGMGMVLGALLLVVGPVVLFGGFVATVMFDRPMGSKEGVVAVGHRYERITRVDQAYTASFERPCHGAPTDAVEVSRRTVEGEERCTMEALRWRNVDELVAEGDGTTLPDPPEGPDDGCEDPGCRRSTSSDRLYVVVERSDGWFPEPEACLVDSEAVWRRWRVGDRGTLTVGRITRGNYCVTLKRGP